MMNKPLRVYHLLPTKYALEDLEQRRLKVAQFADMNDPFELLAIENEELKKKRGGNR